MTLNVQNEITDYWSTSKEARPFHPISRYMSRNRFQELYMRFRIHRSREKGVYEKVLLNPLLLFIYNFNR